MARPVTVVKDVEVALERVRTAVDVKQLRRAQAVVLPQVFGLTLEQTADAIGLSKEWVSRLRNSFSTEEIDLPKQGGRHHEIFSKDREAQLLKPFIEQAARGGILVVGQIKSEFEKASGRKIALSTMYNILHRHGWRKLAPDKHHPQSDPEAQEAFKKTAGFARRSQAK